LGGAHGVRFESFSVLRTHNARLKVKSEQGAIMTKTEWKPLTSETWKDFEELFGERGACGGCWCMAWREGRKEFSALKGEGNRKAMRALVKKQRPLGVLLYEGAKAIGWCAVAPRDEYVRLEGSKVLAPVDEKPVWSTPCFFVSNEHRGAGVSVKLLKAAVEYASLHGAKLVEGYPQDLGGKKLPPPFVWTGLLTTFEKAGFKEVVRRSKTRPIMRKAAKRNRNA
jgi:GNAT superfamily N-acetyltransferase